MNRKGATTKLAVSPSLQPGRAGLKWLDQNQSTNMLVGAILMVLQPDLYEIGCKVLAELAADPDIVKNSEHLSSPLSKWNLPFNSISIYSHRTTPLHRDTLGRNEWMDLMLALGYYEHGRLELSGLNIAFKYDPGTIVAFSGKLMQYGMICNGEHAYIAYSMVDHVLDRLHQRVVPWENMAKFRSIQKAARTTSANIPTFNNMVDSIMDEVREEKEEGNS